MKFRALVRELLEKQESVLIYCHFPISRLNWYHPAMYSIYLTLSLSYFLCKILILLKASIALIMLIIGICKLIAPYSAINSAIFSYFEDDFLNLDLRKVLNKNVEGSYKVRRSAMQPSWWQSIVFQLASIWLAADWWQRPAAYSLKYDAQWIKYLPSLFSFL